MEPDSLVLTDEGVSDPLLEVDMSKILARALRFNPSVDFESRLELGDAWSEESPSGIDEEGIQNELDITDPTPDDRREEVEVRFESILGARVDVDSRGRTLSPLEAVEVDKRLFLPGIIEPKRMEGSGFSRDDRRSGCGRAVPRETVASRGGEPAELRDPTSQDSPLPVAPDVSFAIVELFARRLPMVAVGESLRDHPPIRAMDRTERIARSAIEPVFGSSASFSGTGVAARDDTGRGEAERRSVCADDIEETGGDCIRTLDGWEPGAGAVQFP